MCMKKLTDTIMYHKYPNIHLKYNINDSDSNIYKDLYYEFVEDVYQRLIPLYKQNFFAMVCLYGYNKRLMDDLHDHLEATKDSIGDSMIGYLRTHYRGCCREYVKSNIFDHTITSKEAMHLLLHSIFRYVCDGRSSGCSAPLKMNKTHYKLSSNVKRIFRNAYMRYCKRYLSVEIERVMGADVSIEDVYYVVSQFTHTDDDDVDLYIEKMIHKNYFVYFYTNIGPFINRFILQQPPNNILQCNILNLLLDLYYYGGSMHNDIVDNSIYTFFDNINNITMMDELMFRFVSKIAAITVKTPDDDHVTYFFSDNGKHGSIKVDKEFSSMYAVSLQQPMNFNMYCDLASNNIDKQDTANDNNISISLKPYIPNIDQVISDPWVIHYNDRKAHDEVAPTTIRSTNRMKEMISTFSSHVDHISNASDTIYDLLKNACYYLANLYEPSYYNDLFDKVISYRIYDSNDGRVYYKVCSVKTCKHYPYWYYVMGNNIIDDRNRILGIFSFTFEVSKFFDGPIQIPCNIISKRNNVSYCVYSGVTKEDSSIVHLVARSVPKNPISDDEVWLSLLNEAILTFANDIYDSLKNYILTIDRLYELTLDNARKDYSIHFDTKVCYDRNWVNRDDMIEKLFTEYGYYCDYNLIQKMKKFVKFDMIDEDNDSSSR